MHTSNKELMQQARASLAGKWGVAVGATLLFGVISTAAGMVPGVGFIMSILISGPISLGTCMLWLAFARGQEVAVTKPFDGFKYLGNALFTTLLMFLRIFLWALLLIIPGIIASYSYSMSFFILADNPHMKPGEVLRTSKAMMMGHKWKLFYLSCRFIGWAFLCIFTPGIGFLWLMPYMKVSVAKFYEAIKGEKAVATAVSGVTM
jgi:uncharacterized membrane protein